MQDRTKATAPWREQAIARWRQSASDARATADSYNRAEVKAGRAVFWRELAEADERRADKLEKESR